MRRADKNRMRAARILTTLEKIRDQYGDGTIDAKRLLLTRLQHIHLRSARDVARLHELLCWLRAYPDDARVLRLVERLLAGFERRADLRRHRAALADSGIAGTAINYPFFWSTARWLVQRWPGQLRLNRDDSEAEKKLRAALPKLVTSARKAWLRDSGLDAFTALDQLRGRMTDAAWLVRSVEALPGDTFSRETFFDDIEPWCEFAPGRGTPSRTQAKYATPPISFQTGPLRKSRPDLREQILRAPRASRVVSMQVGQPLLELARSAMLTRSRDLDAFAYGNPQEVRIINDTGGLSFAVNSMLAVRRRLRPAIYGYLILQNGVPIGYGELGITGRHAAISFNVFETFRGGETAWLFARTLAAVRQLFGAGSFTLDPYQLGKGNDEAITSGAWWFYYKLGFRPQSAGARRVLRAELARMQANGAYRSSTTILRKLAEWPLFFDLDPATSPVR